VDLSVSETLFNLVMIGNYKKAQKLRNEFKIPAARFYQVKISALAKRGKWDTLLRFANEKKSPIGYKVGWSLCVMCAALTPPAKANRRLLTALQPFADVCIEARQIDDAMQYIERFHSSSDKIMYYIQIQYVRVAWLGWVGRALA